MTDPFLQSGGQSDEALYSWVMSELPSQIGGPLLDLGCGKGAFLKGLHATGLGDLRGCDGHAFDGVSSAPFKFIKADLNARLPFVDQQFEVVTAIEVVEHLENPRHLAREIHRILKPGGHAIVTTPNNECLTSLLSLNMRGFFSAFSDQNYPAHITSLLEVDLRRVFGECGFEGVQVKWSNKGRVPASGLHWQRLSRKIFRGKRFSDQIMIKGTRARA
jgi:SAM-dependent methyltransferase